MKYWKIPRIFILVISFVAVFAFILVATSSTTNVKLTHPSVIMINDGWTIIHGNQTFENVYIATADIGVVNDLEEVIISRPLDDYNIENPCLAFYTIHAIVRVFLDDEEIYSFGVNYYSSQNTVPKRHHHVALGNKYQGKKLSIHILGGRNRSFSGFSDVFLGTRSDILISELEQNSIYFITSLFLFTLGVALIILSPYLFVFHNNDLRIFFSGLISLMLAIYIMSFNGIIDIIIGNSFLNTILEYASLYNIPTAIVGYLMAIYSGKKKKLFASMFSINIFLFIASIVVHVVHLARFSDFTIVLHIVSGVEAIVAIYVIIRSYMSHKSDLHTHSYSAENVFMGGLILFMILSLVDIVRYNLEKYGSNRGETHADLTGFTIGALIFVTSLLLSYFFYNIFSTNIDSMQSKIMNLAYTDALTGLSNRARCEQMMNMLTEENAIYAIISMDLNRLKQVNDTLGHHEGDRLLTGFSTIISDCFWDANLIGRMGGDEFIIIFLEDRTLNLTKRIHEFYSMINEWNNKEQVFKYSASYGYAYSYEVPNGSAKEVYMLADNRMYEMKREQHESEEKEVVAHA